MPEFQRQEKRVGLHSAIFRKAALQANGLRLVPSRKPPPTAKVRLESEPTKYWLSTLPEKTALKALVLLCYTVMSLLEIAAVAGIVEVNGRCQSQDPDGRGDLSARPDGRAQQTAHSRQLSGPRPVAMPAPVGPESRGTDSGAVLSVWRGEWQWTPGARLARKLALHCIVLEKLSTWSC